jgi:hypothetical protein
LTSEGITARRIPKAVLAWDGYAGLECTLVYFTKEHLTSLSRAMTGRQWTFIKPSWCCDVADARRVVDTLTRLGFTIEIHGKPIPGVAARLARPDATVKTFRRQP